ncbi:MAG: hypothetical protein RJQ04_22025 [Longimicrobiales bacterium]
MPTSADPPTHREVGELLARAGLDRVRARLHARLAHDLNGRASTLLAVHDLLEEGPSEDALHYLEAEVGSIERLVKILRTLPAEAGGEGEAMIPGETAEEAARLAERQRGLEGVPCAVEAGTEVAPVLAGRTRLVAALLLLIAAAQEPWMNREAPGPVVVGLSEEPGVVVFTVRGPPPPDGGEAAPTTEAGALDAVALEALDAVLRLDGGGAARRGDGALVARVQTLAAGRGR